MIAQTDPAPAWFAAAIAVPSRPGRLEIDDLTVSYRVWGPEDGQVTVLVHGGAAHSGWWHHIAPLLGAGRRVVALDLSGHGDSGHRPTYSIDGWARELLAVVSALGGGHPAALVGHSMGGYVVLRAAALHPELVADIVVVDSKIGGRSPEQMAAAERRAYREHRTYASADEAIAHFRPVPAIDSQLWYVVRHIAGTSIREGVGGWQWKFDPKVFLREPGSPLVAPAVRARLVLLRSERGLLTTEMAELVQRDLGRRVPVVELPNATHHAMLDEPLVLVAALRTVLAEWARDG